MRQLKTIEEIRARDRARQKRWRDRNKVLARENKLRVYGKEHYERILPYASNSATVEKNEREIGKNAEAAEAERRDPSTIQGIGANAGARARAEVTGGDWDHDRSADQLLEGEKGELTYDDPDPEVWARDQHDTIAANQRRAGVPPQLAVKAAPKPGGNGASKAWDAPGPRTELEERMKQEAERFAAKKADRHRRRGGVRTALD